jgi:hypothetical protein
VNSPLLGMKLIWLLKYGLSSNITIINYTALLISQPGKEEQLTAFVNLFKEHKGIIFHYKRGELDQRSLKLKLKRRDILSFQLLHLYSLY